MTPGATLSVAHRVLLHLADRPEHELYASLRQFAAGGDIEVLRHAIEAGIPQRFPADSSPLFAVVAPLRDLSRNNQVASNLITDWQAACGHVSQAAMDKSLAETGSADCAADLIAYGANPNGWIDRNSNPSYTSLWHAIKSGMTDSQKVMLETLAQRDEMPMYCKTKSGVGGSDDVRNLFALLASASTSRSNWNAEVMTMEFLAEMGMPSSWSMEMGRALLRETETASFNLGGSGLNVAMQVLVLAAFEDKRQWYAILGKSRELVDQMIQDSDSHDPLKAIARRAVADGASIDDIPCFVKALANPFGKFGDLAPDLYRQVTLLQSAVLHRQPELVKVFIDMGASLDVVLPHWERMPHELGGATLLEIAQRCGDVEMGTILSSALAKRRVDEVIAQSRQQSNGSRPR